LKLWVGKYSGLTISAMLMCAMSVCAAQESASTEVKKSKETTVPSAHAIASLAASATGKEAKKGGDIPDGLVKQTEQIDPSIYHIGVEDDLQISVWKEPDLSVSVVVRTDGMITMPLLNDIRIVGLTTTELQTLLTEKLKSFVNEPQVTVVVRGIKSRKVYVYGQINKAGAYALVGKKTVLEVLAEAGGLSLFAKKGSIYVLRETAGKKERIPFNYNSALKGKNPNDNFELLPGDIIVVP
jgi:polysaccharide export outer membrane protein